MKLISHTRHYMPNVNLKKTYNIMRLLRIRENGLLSSSGNIIESAQCYYLGGA